MAVEFTKRTHKTELEVTLDPGIKALLADPEEQERHLEIVST